MTPYGLRDGCERGRRAAARTPPCTPRARLPRARDPVEGGAPRRDNRAGAETKDAPTLALAGNDLHQVPAVVELSRHTLRVARQNYGLAIGVNPVGLVAGAGGPMNPVLAALLHNTSSIAAVGNSTQLVNHTPSPAARE